MKTKALRKFTNKTGISCFMLNGSVPPSVGFYVSGEPRPEVKFLTVAGESFVIPPFETAESEVGRAHVLGRLNEVVSRDGCVFAPQNASYIHAPKNRTYHVVGDVDTVNIFGDKFLHVRKDRVKVYVYDENNVKVNKIKLAQGSRIFLAQQDLAFNVSVDPKEESWVISPPEGAIIIDTRQTFINRKESKVVRIKSKHWVTLPDGSLLASRKAKIKFYNQDGDIHNVHHVSAGSVFHPAELIEDRDGRKFYRMCKGHVMLTNDYVKIDYLVVPNLVDVTEKANAQ